MNAADAADSLRDSMEQTEDAARTAADKEHDRVDRFRKRAALLVAAMAALLAISALGGDNATKTTIDANIRASDTYSFFQAKNIRQTDYNLAADELETLIAATNPPEAVRAATQQKIDRYRATAARYESEPETGEGKKELLATAQHYVQQREHGQRQDPNFDFAQALFQIGIVLASVAIVAVSRPALIVALVLGGLATFLMLNGFMLWVDLPFLSG